MTERTPSKIYRAHRENQREHILEVAEHLLVERGIDMVSLSDIARVARITRNTLYEYFPNKQEIVWAIFQKFMEAGREGLKEELEQFQGSGFQRIENFMLRFVDLRMSDTTHLRFIVEFNTLYAREGNPARVRQMWGAGYDLLAEMFRQGVADGSLRADLDPELLSAAMMNLLSGMNSRFALLGDLIHEEYGQPAADIYREICRAFLRGIQSNPFTPESIQ
ncbi:MAG TPA: TetR/AcrR family transcriptional regulator [Anaerolinea sp.]|nr:TetR/AcrR family transcriptional regulator [Anaerolinea sp.]